MGSVVSSFFGSFSSMSFSGIKFPSMNNVQRFTSEITEKFPSMNNVQRFTSEITEKFPSMNNTKKFFKPVGNLASKATSALTSNTSKTIAKNVGTAILKNEIRQRTGVYKPKRRHTFGGSKKKEISDKFNTIHDEITSKKETTHSKKEKKPPKKETTPSKKEKKSPKKEKTPPKKEKKSSKK